MLNVNFEAMEKKLRIILERARYGVEPLEDLEQELLNLHSVSVSFADYLISDFEMVSEGVEEELLWQLCGTKQRYTSEEIYNVFMNERLRTSVWKVILRI